MTHHLDDFAAEMHQRIDAFVADYKRQHQQTPGLYPLRMTDDNAGLWDEMFAHFDPGMRSNAPGTHLPTTLKFH